MQYKHHHHHHHRRRLRHHCCWPLLCSWLKFSKHSRALDLDRTNERTAEENWLQPASQTKNAIVYVFESIIALLLLLAGCSPARPSSCVSVDHHSTNKLSTHALVVGPRGRCECMSSAIHGWWRWALLDRYACVMMPQVCGCRRLPIIIISPTRVTLITTDACSKSLFYSFQTTRVFWMVNRSKNRFESIGAIWDAVTVTEEFGKSYFSSKTRKNSKFRR